MRTVPANLPMVQPTAIDRVAAHLVTQGYRAPEYAIDRLAAGQAPEELERMGLLEPEDRDEVERLLAIWDERHDAEMAVLEASRPYPEELPFVPSDEDLAAELAWQAMTEDLRSGMDRLEREHPLPRFGFAFLEPDRWPALKTADDRRADREEVRRWFADHPQG